MLHRLFPLSIALLAGCAAVAAAYDTRLPAPHEEYLRSQVAQSGQAVFTDRDSPAEITARLATWRGKLAEMLGLPSLDHRPPLQAQVTGRIRRDGYSVENILFQSLPQLYVTGNLYLPAGANSRVPAVLYVCGHSNTKENGISYGSKVSYRRYGPWFARNGYACLIIDTLQLGEIEGIHHGLYREGMWWWASRGYTPAGVEAWNGIRALDYLQSRPEVDGSKLAVTGRSGGGATSWWVTALDERVRASAPTAGITDLQDHVIDDVIEGHCDCMYQLNAENWDFDRVAALAAPRPLLLVNTDSDPIFPLAGVLRLHSRVRDVYRRLDAETNLGLVISEGGHKDWAELQVSVMRWFNRHLKGIEDPGKGLPRDENSPADLRVLKSIPADERNTRIHESFVPAAEPAAPASEENWRQLSSELRSSLDRLLFSRLPGAGRRRERTLPPIRTAGLEIEPVEIVGGEASLVRGAVAALPETAGGGAPLVLVAHGELETLVSDVHESKEPGAGAAALVRAALADHQGPLFLVAPRSNLPGDSAAAEKNRVHLRRRYLLVGSSLEAMQIHDVSLGLRWAAKKWPGRRLDVAGEGDGAVAALYAALRHGPVGRLDLRKMPASHRASMHIANIQRSLDLPQSAALALDSVQQLRITSNEPGNWSFTSGVASLKPERREKLEILLSGG